MFRLVGPDHKAFHGSETISKLTEGTKNGAEAFCGAMGSSLVWSCFCCYSWYENISSCHYQQSSWLHATEIKIKNCGCDN